MSRKKFVFLVCGSREHIETLNFSLPVLASFSKFEILVVTDLKRNEIPIDHNAILNIPTPSEFNHHQASIYLKTGLHKWLEPGCLYCYLDTDVIALDSRVDTIFDHYKAPISFCSDHCKMQQFALYAVSTPVEKKIKAGHLLLNKLFEKYRADEQDSYNEKAKQIEEIKTLGRRFLLPPPYQGSTAKEASAARVITYNGWQLFKQLLNLNRNAWKFLQINFLVYFPLLLLFRAVTKIMTWLPVRWERKVHTRLNHNNRLIYYLQKLDTQRKALWLGYRKFHKYTENHGLRYDPHTTRWYDLRGNFIYEENFIANRIQQETPYRWHPFKKDWVDEDGNIIGFIASDSLTYLIRKKFGVHISQRNWQHWNGGVFLFDFASYEFMETWHQWTLAAFDDPLWETRDQGTLIATAWKFGLKDHPTLPLEYNFIADYNHPTMQYLGDLTFKLEDRGKRIRPYFLHIYHHFGDKTWRVWQDVEILAIAHTK